MAVPKTTTCIRACNFIDYGINFFQKYPIAFTAEDERYVQKLTKWRSFFHDLIDDDCTKKSLRWAIGCYCSFLRNHASGNFEIRTHLLPGLLTVVFPLQIQGFYKNECRCKQRLNRCYQIPKNWSSDGSTPLLQFLLNSLLFCYIHQRDLPAAVKQWRRLLLRPIQPHHQDEFSLLGRQSVGILAFTRRFVLNIKINRTFSIGLELIFWGCWVICGL